MEDGECGPHTWAALIEADFRLGDRMLYLRSPMTRGDDITDLQQRLGSLGFDAGYVDGIFGPDTESAVRNFQANQGLTPDGVVGPDTVMALGRLAGRRSGEKTIAEVRETERLRSQHGLQGRRIVVGETGGIAALIDTLARRLRADGAEVLTLHQPDLSAQAKTANEWDGAVYLGVTLAAEDLSVRTSRPRASSRPVAEVWPSTQATRSSGLLMRLIQQSVCVFRFCGDACRPCGARWRTPRGRAVPALALSLATHSPAGAIGRSFEPTNHCPLVSPGSSRGCPPFTPRFFHRQLCDKCHTISSGRGSRGVITR